MGMMAWREGRRGGLAGGLLLGAALLWPAASLLWHGFTRGQEGAGGLFGGARMVDSAGRRTMPAVAYDRLDGGTWRVQDDRGKVVVINLWATWCGPCLEEMPELERLEMRRRREGLVVVGLAMDSDGVGGPEKVQRVVERLGVRYPVLLLPEGSQMESGLEGLPTTILVDRAGRVARTYLGAVEEPGFERDVEELLREGDGR